MPIWLDQLNCDGTEENLLYCDNSGLPIGVTDCVHMEDAAAKCNQGIY